MEYATAKILITFGFGMHVSLQRSFSNPAENKENNEGILTGSLPSVETFIISAVTSSDLSFYTSAH